MNFNMTEPCNQCPFRTDVNGYLTPERIDGLKEDLVDGQKTFSCHKTIEHGEDGEGIDIPTSEHCAGALIMLEKLERPNQMMRWMERIGCYDRHKLKMDAPVFDNFEEMREAQE